MARILKGITWGHSRGITPLLAVSQRYSELNPGTEIRWTKRSLQEFADFPIEKLAPDYDLLIIDHPWVGCAAATGCVIPLDDQFPPAYLQDQAANSVGNSHASYNYAGRQWALAIDAAAPAASYRKDLFEKNNCSLPGNWEELLELADRGKVAVPAIPIDLLMNFYTFCIAHGQQPFHANNELIDRETGLAALEAMWQLYSRVDKKMFELNPIAVAELMSQVDDYWYCPFAYCYSNYSRNGFSRQLLHYANVVSYKGQVLKTTIGGTGLAVSSFSRHKENAIDFAAMVVSGECQRTLYVQHGGQPGHRTAWLDEEANRITHNFFMNLLPVMDNGYTRPRYNGYLHFQDQAGIPLQYYLLGKLDAAEALQQMNRLYKENLIMNPLIETA
ncbi:MAG TPA: extracellular solute-binding protein [Chitinophagaceae bacterium]|nr:extracellular solute-binding protein [Chitinophagaceae bacterium]